MPRISAARKQKYKSIAPEDGSCFFCNVRSATKIEYTPSQRVSDDIWPGLRTSHAACQQCWSRFYYRNQSSVTNGLSGFVRGTLSVEEKLKLISKLSSKHTQNAP
jgi:hypothetical protein